MTIAPPLEPAAPEPFGATEIDPHRAGPRTVGRLGRALDPIDATPRRWIRHALALAVVLGALLAVVGTQQIVSADEGAALLQAKIITQTGQWGLPQRTEIDPSGAWFPIHLSNAAGDKMFPFSRPPIYPLLIEPVFDAGGLPGVMAMQAFALLLTALFTGLLAERVRKGRGIQTMWLVGVLSPLLFDGYWVIAHSIVAAGVAAAALGAVKLVVDGQARWLVAWFLGLSVAVLFRSEPLLFAAALSVALGFSAAFARGSRRLLSLAMAAGTAGVGLAGYWVSTVWRRVVEDGSHAGGYTPDTAGGAVAGRLKGFEHSVLGAGTVGKLGPLLVVTTLALVVVAVVATRFDLGTLRLQRATAWAGAAAAILRLLMPVDLITGLLMAAPVLVVAGLCAPWARLREPATRMVAITAWLTVLGVAATEHDTGGAGEWGGRYFHIAVPFIAILAMLSLDWILTNRAEVGRAVVGALLVTCVAYGALSIRASHDLRRAAQEITDTSWTTALTTRSAHQRGGPVVVSTWVAGGRFAWQHILDGRYLTVAERHDYPSLGERLAEVGVPDFTVIAEPGDRAHLNEIGSGYRITRTIPVGTHGWTVDVMSRS